MTQRSIAVELGCSPSTLSLVGSGARKLSDAMATKLSLLFGGSPDNWKDIHRQTQSGSKHPVAYFRAILNEYSTLEDLPGARVRRLRREHILEFMQASPNSGLQRETLSIDGFAEERLRVTSYDTAFGSFFSEDTGKDEEINGTFVIPAGRSILMTTKEAVTMPMWMEADVHPATSLARKHLIVSGGPIIDPGFDDFLVASVFNPTRDPIEVNSNDTFLTLRFWLHELDR
ncbi:hypothetical protein [uncultured Tateyamaria sp.]|uniref:dCTP deaminase domain-containing protein n=1 Tax=uncultured Tateyamaria sp. TaxID=455651 RepID=UPI00262BD0F5|nr:hypothetical protein [uncultured Tateyamaria sp.]